METLGHRAAAAFAVAGIGIDPVARLVANRLAQSSVTIGVLAAEASLSPRQPRRRCQAAFGYPPSALAQVLRLQRFLRLASMHDRRRPLSGPWCSGHTC